MIDATYSQAHRAAWNLRITQGIAAGRSVAPKRGMTTKLRAVAAMMPTGSGTPYRPSLGSEENHVVA